MSTQDPYGSSDPSREQRTGSSPDTGSSGSSSGSSQYGSSYGQPQGQPHDQQYGQQPQQYGQGYGQPQQHGGYGQAAPRNGLGIAALVLGVLALLSGFFIIGGLFGLVAIVLGIIGARRAKRGEATNRGMAITGIILGVVGVLIAAVVFAIGAFFTNRALDCQSFLTSGDDAGYEQCIAEQLGVDAQQLDS